MKYRQKVNFLKKRNLQLKQTLVEEVKIDNIKIKMETKITIITTIIMENRVIEKIKIKKSKSNNKVVIKINKSSIICLKMIMKMVVINKRINISPLLLKKLRLGK